MKKKIFALLLAMSMPVSVMGMGFGEPATGAVLMSTASPVKYGFYKDQVKLSMREEKIISSGMNAVVGRMMIPDGWTVQVIDLTTDSESIACPNAVYVTVTAPDESCELKFVSRRVFQQVTNADGTTSEDGGYDDTTHMRTFNYRNAKDACALMADLFYAPDSANAGNTPYFKSTGSIPLIKSDEEKIAELQENFEKVVGETYAQASDASGEPVSTELTIAKETFSDENHDVAIFACSESCEVKSGETDAIMWSMPFAYGMRTPKGMLDRYRELFDVFCASTSVSKEFEQMRDENAEKMANELTAAQEEGKEYTPDVTFGDISGESYGALNTWDGKTQYTTGEDNAALVGSNFEHVFESDGIATQPEETADSSAESAETTAEETNA